MAATAVDRLLEGLDDSQREAVVTPAMPLCILAGAGSGKTRVLTRRIAHRIATGTASAEHVLALTFSRRAAGELVERLGHLDARPGTRDARAGVTAGARGARAGVTAGTFHAIAFATLREHWARNGWEPPELLDRKVRLVGPMVGGGRRRGGGAVTAADVVAEIEWAKARLVGPGDYEQAVGEAGRVPPLPPAAIAGIYRRYEVLKRDRRLVDFDDLLALCARALERDEELAAAQRDRHRHLFVDEYQDVNPLQHRLLEAWRGGRDDLCVVGDPDQAIYAWNGADARFLREFAVHHPRASVVRLRHNYRSTPEILAAGAAVLAELPDPAPPPVPHRPSGPRPTVQAFDDDADEARGIGRMLHERHDAGRRWADLAVLTRTNAQLAVLEEALRADGVPYRVRGGGALLDQPEVRAWLGRRERDLERWTGALTAALDDAEAGTALPPERRANLEQLVRLAGEYRRDAAEPTLAGFGEWLTVTLSRDGDGGRGSDAVDLVTFHAAKGLEWPVVVLAGMEKGLVPHAQSTTPEDRAEETRLAYVAITRAQDELHVTWAQQRTFGERVARRSPSPFVAVVESAGRPAAARPGDAAGRPRERRRREPDVAPGDVELLAALKAWRREEASAAGVPAYVVFPDASLASAR
jgi:DNA helicase-2/ATP-dependent DNA helicase PcrA